jgi:fumarate reductase flavoprotein subunit
MTRTLKDGEYTAQVDGQNGPMTVKTTITGGKIANVEIVEHNETAGIGDMAFAVVPEAITAANNPSVEAVTAATLSSNRIMNAVALCLEQAAE